MKTQITNRNNDTFRFQWNKNAGLWRSAAIAAVMLLATANHAGAQARSSSESDAAGLTYGPTTCWASPTGGNGCMSPQYRSGASSPKPGSSYNANLTGNPVGDKNILNPTTVNATNMVLLPNSPIYSPGALAGYQGGCQPSSSSTGLLPTASVSVESRILFPALDGNGNCALFTYDVTWPTGAQYVADLGTTNPHVTSSPGYNGNVVIGAEDGNVYAYGWASNQLAWTFSSPYGAGFDASPATWPGLNYVYVVDVVGHIFYLNPGDGTQAHVVNSGLSPGGAGWFNNDSVSASSVSASSAHNLIFVAGVSNSYPYGDEICAQDATSAAPAWCQNFTSPANPVAEDSFVTSSPVVSDSQGLVYVADLGQSNTTYSGTSNLYALDVNSGNLKWEVSLLPTPAIKWYSFTPLPYGGSPAYDDSANNGNSKYLITATPYSCYNSFGHGGPCGQGTAIQVFDATVAGNGQLVCSNFTSHLITQSSPEVVDGVIYIGTDDGYVLAYDETQCGNGGLTNIWTSAQMLDPNTGAPDPLLGPPVVSYNRVHAVTESGSLYVWHTLGH